MSDRRYRLGLVLSGGGAWGFAHIGLIQALEELKITPDIVAGASMGALVGALYADGYTAKEIIQVTEKIRYTKFATIHVPRRSLLELSWVERLLHTTLRAATFEELKKPLVVAATNLSKGEAVHFSSGTLIDKIVASASIPVLFPPVTIAGDDYVDGGVLDNFPAAAIRRRCERVIGMHVEPAASHHKLNNMIRIAEQLLTLFIRTQSTRNAHFCEVFIEPDLKNYGFWEFTKAKKIAALGYEAAMKALKDFR